MRFVGMNPVVVHGGGPQITELMQRLGKQPEFVDGLRITDAETVDIVRMALVGKVNREIVVVGQPPRLVRGRALGRGRGPDHGVDARRAPRLRRRRVEHRPVDRGAAAQRGPDPGDRDHRRRRDGPGLQHQRRHRRRRDRGGTRRREARLPHRRRRSLRRLSRRVHADLADRRRRAQGARGRRQAVGGDDPEDPVVRRRGEQRRAARPHPRRPHPARAAARVLHA